MHEQLSQIHCCALGSQCRNFSCCPRFDSNASLITSSSSSISSAVQVEATVIYDASQSLTLSVLKPQQLDHTVLPPELCSKAVTMIFMATAFYTSGSIPLKEPIMHFTNELTMRDLSCANLCNCTSSSAPVLTIYLAKAFLHVLGCFLRPKINSGSPELP